MSNLFFEKPILNSPYGYPSQHWELDETGQPTQKILEARRRAEFLTPIPKPKKRTLEDQRDTAVEKGFTDITLLLPDVKSLNNLLEGYGDAQLAIIEKAILDWYESNRWKVASPSKKASSAEPEDEAETV